MHTILGDMNLEIDVLDKKQMDEVIKNCEQINKERIEKLLEKAQKERNNFVQHTLYEVIRSFTILFLKQWQTNLHN